MNAQDKVAEEVFKAKVAGIPNIFEVILITGTILLAVGSSEDFIFNLNMSITPHFVTFKVLNMSNGEQQPITVSVRAIAMVSPNRTGKDLLGEEAPKGVLWEADDKAKVQ